MLDPHLTQCGQARLTSKFHPDPPKRLATMHQRHRQTEQTGQRSDNMGRSWRTVLQTVTQLASELYCNALSKAKFQGRKQDSAATMADTLWGPAGS